VLNERKRKMIRRLTVAVAMCAAALWGRAATEVVDGISLMRSKVLMDVKNGCLRYE